MAELPLFAHLTAEPIRFDGASYDAAADEARLTGQLQRVFECMKDGRWRTLGELHRIAGATEASVSARLRDLRKPRFGGHTVNRRARGERSQGVFEYQLIVKG
jgi:hypothetical protein